MGKVTISTVLGYKEYVVENIKNVRGEDEENSDFRIYPDYHKIYRGQTEIVLTKAEYEPKNLYVVWTCTRYAGSEIAGKISRNHI